ncbi:MAG: CDP-glycerol glycerophosphotransferase family protein [Anaerolineaceae bacterium]|nr:CDP-glycerol glycerophosphotransferase family protein [Anaerolineaceae bacterium]
MAKRIFISADHGMAVVYFLQSDVIKTLLDSGIEVVFLTDEALKDQIEARFGQPGLIVESLKLKEAREFYNSENATEQWWLNFLRRVGGSVRINTEAMDSHIEQVDFEAVGRRKMMMPFMRVLIGLIRRSKWARKKLVQRQMRHIPGLYTDLFEKYQPELVVASTPGWRLDRYLMREAHQKGIETATVIVGWDNSSSYSISGAPVDWATCWSEKQKEELVLGSDWDPEKVHIGGIPSYDGYIAKKWLMSKAEYFDLHNLDPQRKLLSFACSFITFSPNFQIIEVLAKLIIDNDLAEPCQLLIRLHPNHFMDEALFTKEREQIQQLVKNNPHVHLVKPVPLGGELGYYSGEDMPEKTSMMTYSDVFLTVYSTMVVEAAVHDRPIVSACIDAENGWNTPGRFSLALSEIGNWPTHLRFREANAGKVAMTALELRDAVNAYLSDPDADRETRQDFVRQECSFTDGTSGKRTGDYLTSLVNGNK